MANLPQNLLAAKHFLGITGLKRFSVVQNGTVKIRSNLQQPLSSTQIKRDESDCQSLTKALLVIT